MKTLKILLLFALTALITPAFSQDAEIKLQEFTLQIPTVNKLVIRPVGAPVRHVFEPDTVPQLAQTVYYELRRADGRSVEIGNKVIPIAMYNIVYRYVQGNVTPSDISTLNYFFQLSDWPLVAVMPDENE